MDPFLFAEAARSKPRRPETGGIGFSQALATMYQFIAPAPGGVLALDASRFLYALRGACKSARKED
ncbi:hypothetical protein [Senegalimassilia anaerobia]|uniref:hypothetical protein n=1 Tax=Senegalimassilia anaerobia TaxID=1473216 RepID=UPI0026EFB139|nr:hypothetical protein [Senegalimassilia anaerobia]